MITLALVLTPVASARALAALCSLDGIDADIVPTSRGAVVVRAIGGPAEPGAAEDGPPELLGEGMHPEGELAGTAADTDLDVDADWDIGELLDDDVPPEARDLAARISCLTRVGIVLLTARLTEDGALDSGLSGQISAQEYTAGEPGEDLAAGLVLAGADDVVEDLILGRRSVTDVPGHVSSHEAGRGRRPGGFGKGRRSRS